MIPEAYGCHESPILPPYVSVSKERRYAVEGTAPHRIVLRVLMGIFREISGKSRKEIDKSTNQPRPMYTSMGFPIPAPVLRESRCIPFPLAASLFLSSTIAN